MVYVLSGDEYKIEERIRELGEGREVIRLSGDDASPEKVLELLKTFPMFSERLIVLEGVLGKMRGKGWDEVKGALRNLAGGVMVAFKEEKVEGEIEWARVEEYKPLRARELEKWIRESLRKRGREITDAGIKALLELVGSDPFLIEGEVEKLAFYKDGVIDEEDVRMVVSHTKEESIFSLTDAVAQGEKRRALFILENLFREGLTPPQILHMITRHFRLIIKVKEGDMEDIKDFTLRRLEEQGRAISMERLKKIYRELLCADMAIKGGVLGGELSLELLISEICEGG